MNNNTFASNADIPDGTIFETDVGWSMVIPKFWKVVGKRGNQTVVLSECRKVSVSGDGWQGTCVPGEAVGAAFLARINKYGHVKIDGHCAVVYDGKPSMYDYMD
jgi:hypothetical protein